MDLYQKLPNQTFSFFAPWIYISFGLLLPKQAIIAQTGYYIPFGKLVPTCFKEYIHWQTYKSYAYAKQHYSMKMHAISLDPWKLIFTSDNDQNRYLSGCVTFFCVNKVILWYYDFCRMSSIHMMDQKVDAYMTWNFRKRWTNLYTLLQGKDAKLVIVL